MAGELTPSQRIGLLYEASTAGSLLRAGLEGLPAIDGSNDFYRLPFTILGQGLERLMKIAVALEALETTGRLPTSLEIRRTYGHDLPKLVAECARIALADPTYRYAEDAAALADPFLELVIVAIAAHGNEWRYADLDRFLGSPVPIEEDPERRVGDMERSLRHRHPEWQAKLYDVSVPIDDWYRLAASELTATVQRLARAVTRILLWRAVDIGKPVTVALPFLAIRDEDLGELPARWRSGRH